MLAAIDCGFEGFWQSLANDTAGATIPAGTSRVSNISNMGFIGVVTTKPLVPGHKCLVLGDYSIYCPSLAAFVKPEQTNIQNILPI